MSDAAEVLIGAVGAVIIATVAAHFMGWWVVPRGIGVGLVQGARA